MPDSARRPSLPLIVAAVAGAVALALAIVYFVVVRPDDNSPKASAAFTRTEREVLSAANTEVINIQTLSRASFDKDWQRALAGTTGALRSDLAKDKARTLDALKKAKVDLRASVSHIALESAGKAGSSYLVLVTMQGYQVSGKKQSLPTSQRLELTMLKVKGKWLISDISQRGLSA
jgi:Mce-associated membrane protein